MTDAETQNRVGVLGATSLVGACLLPMLSKTGAQVTAFSRSPMLRPRENGVAWHPLCAAPLADAPNVSIRSWVCLAPIGVLLDYFDLLEAHGVRRVVVLSSTSIFTKKDSIDPHEQAIAQKLVDAEKRVREWAQRRGVEWVILRPTLIYGMGLDKNITEIARFIQRFGFFPVFGKANGLRQPIHAADVAATCLAALQRPGAANQTYNISGGETLTYCNMVTRVCSCLGRRAYLLPVPLWTFRLAVKVLRRLPRYRLWSVAMAERMCRDLVFDHAEAARDLDFNPRPFLLTAGDLPT